MNHCYSPCLLFGRAIQSASAPPYLISRQAAYLNQNNTKSDAASSRAVAVAQSRRSLDIHLAGLGAGEKCLKYYFAADWLLKSMPVTAGSF